MVKRKNCKLISVFVDKMFHIPHIALSSTKEKNIINLIVTSLMIRHKES